MTLPLYPRDSGMAGRLDRLEEKVRALESGGMFAGKSVLIAGISAFSGAWPQSVSFTVVNPASTIIVIWGGTGFVGTNITFTLNLNIDSVLKDSISLPANNTTSVRLAPPLGVVTLTGLTAGSHTAQIAVGAGSTDSGDRGHIVILELPQ